MPYIKSISSLRNKTAEITELCKKNDEPVYLTKNGEGDLVVMSMEHYEKINARSEIYAKLIEAADSIAKGDKGIPYDEVMKKMRKKISDEKKLRSKIS